jgi:DHA3 family macrolide efflux protein-like MFS transporter
MGWVPLGVLFLVDVVTALGAIAILWFFVRIPAPTSASSPTAAPSYFADLVAGLRYIGSQRFLLLLIVAATAFAIAISPVAFLSPLQVARDFGTARWRPSAIAMIWAGGMIVGGVLVGWWSPRNRSVSIGWASVVIGVGTALLGVWTAFLPYLACMLINGLVTPYSNAPSMTLLQERVAPEFLGRVMSVFTMISSLAMPVGAMIFGPLADVVAIDWLMIGGGSGIVVIGLFYLSSRTLRRAGEPPAATS